MGNNWGAKLVARAEHWRQGLTSNPEVSISDAGRKERQSKKESEFLWNSTECAWTLTIDGRKGNVSSI